MGVVTGPLQGISLWCCPECGCLWLLFEQPAPGNWSLMNGEQKPGKCCDNAGMDHCVRLQVDEGSLAALLAVRNRIAGVGQ